jgi:hypothetical protein
MTRCWKSGAEDEDPVVLRLHLVEHWSNIHGGLSRIKPWERRSDNAHGDISCILQLTRHTHTDELESHGHPAGCSVILRTEVINHSQITVSVISISKYRGSRSRLRLIGYTRQHNGDGPRTLARGQLANKHIVAPELRLRSQRITKERSAHSYQVGSWTRAM